MNKIIFKKCLLMSICMGFLMGLIFTCMNQLKNGGIQPIGVLMGTIISICVSAVIGMIFNMKKVCDWLLASKLGLNTFDRSSKWKYYIGEAIIGSIIFTPFNMFANQLYGMYMGMKMANSFPPFAADLIGRLKFLMTGPYWPAYAKAIIPSILIGIVISLVGTRVFGPITDKICGIDS